VFNRTLRLILTFLGLGTGFTLTYYGLVPLEAVLGVHLASLQQKIAFIILGSVISGLIGFFIAPIFVKYLWDYTTRVERRLHKTPVQDIIIGSFGLILGLVIANLLSAPLARFPGLGVFLPTVSSILLGYLGLSVALKKKDELLGLLNLFPRLGSGREKIERGGVAKVLDTSVIIDGRIADICQSGFIEGTIIIPSFVLQELQHIADSSDLLKRNRGRRGLDVLNRMQKELNVKVQIYERDFPGHLEVDAKLVRLAKLLDAKIITNDYNLNKVAELQGVPVLNINELANAVKPVVLPGEEMNVHVIKDGKEFGQGIGYLDDGTMIVIDGGRKHIGETIGVMVTSVLQTAAGRMIFARPKNQSMERSVAN